MKAIFLKTFDNFLMVLYLETLNPKKNSTDGPSLLLQMKQMCYSPCDIETLGDHLYRWGRAEDSSVLLSSTFIVYLFSFPGPSSSACCLDTGFFRLLRWLPLSYSVWHHPLLWLQWLGLHQPAFLTQTSIALDCYFLLLTLFQSPLNTNT